MDVLSIERTNSDGMTDAEARVAAREMWRRAEASAQPLTGVDLGRAFGKTDRWGRKQIEHARGRRSDRNDAPPTAATRRGAQPAVLVRPRPDEPAGRNGGTAAATGSPLGTAEIRRNTQSPSHARPSGRSSLDVLCMVAVAAVAATASYGHMLEVALMAGEHLWIARLFPITVDGLVLIALRRGPAGRWWLGVGIAVSIAANVAAADPTIQGRLVAGWPPVALYGAHRLLHTDSPTRNGVENDERLGVRSSEDSP